MPDRRFVAAAVLRVLLFLGLWIVLNEGHAAAAMPGLPMALFAAAASLAVQPPVRNWRIGLRLLLLTPRLFVLSLRSGWDVAVRALHPRLPIDPGFVDYRLRRPDAATATALGYLMTLPPGSLAADVDRESVCFHVLDRAHSVEDAAADLVRRLEGEA